MVWLSLHKDSAWGEGTHLYLTSLEICPLQRDPLPVDAMHLAPPPTMSLSIPQEPHHPADGRQPELTSGPSAQPLTLCSNVYLGCRVSGAIDGQEGEMPTHANHLHEIRVVHLKVE